MVAAIVRGIFDEPDNQAAGSIPVTYVGGTFKAGEAILGPLGAALPRCCRLIAPLHEPEPGACLILQKRLGLSL